MKIATVVSTLGTAALVAAVPTPEPQLDGLLSLLGLGGSARPGSTSSGAIAPEVQQIKAKGLAPGSQRVKIRYGPYTIPSTNDMNLYVLTTGERGILMTVAMNMKKPCNNCGVLEMLADLEYANGTAARVENGAWLHHVVVMAGGAGRQDLTCPQGPLSLFGERIFASGNERTPIKMFDNKLQSIFKLRSTDTINMELELMNMEPQAKEAYFTLEYEYLQQPPANWKETKTVWLDVTTCGDSNVYPPANKKQFGVDMRPWQSTIQGDIFFIMGHLHDGGTNLKVIHNNGIKCDSVAKYSQPMSMHMQRRDGPHGAMEPHIADMSVCTNQFRLNRGDNLGVQALYDFNAHAGMSGERGLTPVMGIANVFIAVG